MEVTKEYIYNTLITELSKRKFRGVAIIDMQIIKDGFTALTTGKFILTEEEKDKYVKLVIKGRLSSYLSDPSNLPLLEMLTNFCMLPTTLVAKIFVTLIPCMRDYRTKHIDTPGGAPNRYTMTWYNNLIKHGFVPDGKLKMYANTVINICMITNTPEILENNKPTGLPNAELDPKLKELVPLYSLNDLYTICKTPAPLERLTEFLKVSELIPTFECYKLICGNSHVSWGDVHKYLELFCNYGYVPDEAMVSKIITDSGSLGFENFAFSLNLALRQGKTFNNDTFQYISSAMVTMASSGRVMTQSSAEKYPFLSDILIRYNYFDNIKSIMLERVLVLANKTQDLDLLFSQYNIKLTPDIVSKLCIKACGTTHSSYSKRSGIEDAGSLFAYLQKKNLIVPTDDLLHLACKSGNEYAIEGLINMKITPTQNCAQFIQQSMKETTFDLLVAAGLPLNFNTIVALRRNKYPINFAKYGINASDELYYHYHKLNTAYDGPIHGLHEFRHMFSFGTKLAIMEYITKHKIKPDQFCFDIAFAYNRNDIISWLVESYNMSPTILTLLRCGDYHLRLEHFEKYNNIYKTQTLDNIDHYYIKNTVVSLDSEEQEISVNVTVTPQTVKTTNGGKKVIIKAKKTK